MTALEFITTYYCRIYTHHPVNEEEAESIIGESIANGTWRQQAIKRSCDNFFDKTVSDEIVPMLECKCFGYEPILDRHSISICNGGLFDIGTIDFTIDQKMMFFTTSGLDAALILATASAAGEEVIEEVIPKKPACAADGSVPALVLETVCRGKRLCS